jgi:hypothetical protein
MGRLKSEELLQPSVFELASVDSNVISKETSALNRSAGSLLGSAVLISKAFSPTLFINPL